MTPEELDKIAAAHQLVMHGHPIHGWQARCRVCCYTIDENDPEKGQRRIACMADHDHNDDPDTRCSVAKLLAEVARLEAALLDMKTPPGTAHVIEDADGDLWASPNGVLFQRATGDVYMASKVDIKWGPIKWLTARPAWQAPPEG